MIVDQYGNPIQMSGLGEPQSDALPSISSLRREFDAHPGTQLTPVRLNSILREAEQGDLIKQLELADDMEERDAQIFSELGKRKTAITTLEWDIEPPDNASAAEQKEADQLREWISAIPDFEETILIELMDAVLKGFKPIEMWWQLDQGTLQPQFKPRPQRWLTMNEGRDQLTLRTPDSTYGEALRPFNWIVHQHKSRNGYLARSPLCRVLAFPYLYKNYATRDLAEFLEIYGLPLRIGKYPTSSTDDEKRKLLQAVVSIGHNAGGIIPQAMQLEFQAAAQGSDAPFKTQVDQMDAAESKAILGQTLTSGEGQHGTQALGNVHNEVRLDILKSDARRVSATLTSQLVYPLRMLNIAGANPRRGPRFVIDVPDPEDLQLYADALPKLAGAGMRIGIAETHRRLRIPEAKDNEDILTGASPAATAAPNAPASPGVDGQPPTPVNKAKPDAAAALSTQVTQPVTDAIDELVAEAAGDWRPTLQPLVGPLLAELDRAVEAGESLQAFAKRLPELVQRMDSGPMGERLARAVFATRLAGEADLDLSGTETT